jgi:hypothetical protein
MSNEPSAPLSAASCVIYAASALRFALHCSHMKLILLRVDLALPTLFIAIHSPQIDAAAGAAPGPLAPQPTPAPAPVAENPARRPP